jgi:chromosome segregation ATPase
MAFIKDSADQYKSQNESLCSSIETLQNALEEAAKTRIAVQKQLQNEASALKARIAELEARVEGRTESSKATEAPVIVPLNRNNLESDNAQATPVEQEAATMSSRKKKKKKKKGGNNATTPISPKPAESEEIISSKAPTPEDAYPRRLLEEFLVGMTAARHDQTDGLKSASSELEEGSSLWDESVMRGLAPSYLRHLKITADNLVSGYEVDGKVSELDTKLSLFSRKFVCISKQLEEANVIQLKLKNQLSSAETALEATQKREAQLLDKNQKLESTCEDVEQLRDMLRDVGSNLVEAKDKIKELELKAKDAQSIKLELEATILLLTDDLKAAAQMSQSIDDVRTKVTNAELLADTRLKELSETKRKLGAVDAELVSIKAELGKISVDKNDLISKLADSQVKLRQIERSEKDARDRNTALQTNVNSKEKEITNLRSELNNIQNAKAQMEENLRSVRQELSQIDSERREILQKEKNARDDVTRYKRDVTIYRDKVASLESISASIMQERNALTEEVQLKSTQLESTQSVTQNLREQTTEMAHRAREAKERCEALEEELSETHKLLSERARESDTMRRLLDEAEGREAGRMKAAREKLEVAIEERDHLEEEIAMLRRGNAEGSGELMRTLKAKEGSLSDLTTRHESLAKEVDVLRRRNDSIDNELQKARKEAYDASAKLMKLSATLVFLPMETL